MLVAFFTVVSNINALEFQETTDQIEEGLESCTDPGIARIAGGEPANHSSWPWLVRLAIDDSRFGTLTCGGTIVSNKYVLTAGHCLFFATKVVATFADGSIAENEDAEELANVQNGRSGEARATVRNRSELDQHQFELGQFSFRHFESLWT